MSEQNRCFKECWEEHEDIIESVQREHAIQEKNDNV